MLDIKSQKILFIGCGVMGSAMVKNLIKNGFDPHHIHAVDPSRAKIPGIKKYKDPHDLSPNFIYDIVFVAVKPQNAKETLKEYKNLANFSNNTVFVSIVAGKRMKFFRDILGTKIRLVRAMPNLPIVEGEGVFAYIFGNNVKQFQKKNLLKTFKYFGEAIDLENEKYFHDFTAIFGSGPAYIFYLQELMYKLAKPMKIEKHKLEVLIKKLFLGSALMSHNSNQSFKELCENVTSKKGTTEAGLEVLRKHDIMNKIITKTVKSASKRSKDISKVKNADIAAE